MALVMACQGNKGGEAVQKDGLYGAEARVQSLAPEEKAAVKKARVVRLYEIPAPLKDRPEQILHRKGYTTSYNSQTKTPNWVAWHLTKSHTYGSNQRSDEVFTEDADVTTTTIIRATTEGTCVRQATTNGTSRLCSSRSCLRISVRRTTG